MHKKEPQHRSTSYGVEQALSDRCINENVRKFYIIDIDCATIIEGKETIEEAGERILKYIIAVASGEEMPKAVLLEQDDFIPWKRGVSL